MAFGGSIKLEGETEYKKALASIMQTYKELQSELKLVTSQFDKNDKSQDALKAKAEAMNKLLEQQKAKLDLLNDRYAELNRLAEQQRSNIQSLTEKYRSEVSTLEELERSIGKASDEYKKQESVVRDLENQLDKETKANEQTETAMSKLRVEMNNTQTEANKTGREMDNLGNETEEAGKDAENAANGGFTILKGVIANLASEAISKAVEGVKNLASKLVDVGKQSYTAFAEYEQLVGGVETLYGESADRLEEYAKNAYKTAGVSANKYMEQATSFAATLLQGLDGDTEKAVDYADMAIRDMADNANKMGTNISMIQNAYQGFAKDNFTMLDNLKLGYGGTASEMARLVNEMKVLGLDDAGELITVDAQSVKNVGLDKMIEAIHLAQQQLGITGTTAKEAEGTITGSMGQVAAAFENLKVAFATGDGNEVRGWVETLTQTIEIMLKNAIPRIKNIVKGMWTGIKKILRDNLPGVANSLIPFIDKVKKAVSGLFDFIKNNGDTIIAIIKGVVAAFLTLKVASIIQSVTTALGGLLTMANPLGIFVTVVAGLTGAMIALSEAFKEEDKDEIEWRARIAENTDIINEQVESWNNLKTAQEDYVQKESSKLDYYESLWEELKKITDENGKIKEGYEERAKFITGTLSEAMGIEIEIVDGVVQKYNELKTAMSDMFKQKRASVVLSAQQEMYDAAIEQQDARLEALRKQRELLEEAQAKLEEAENAEYTDKRAYRKTGKGPGKYRVVKTAEEVKAEAVAAAQATVDELQKSYDEAANAVDEGLYYIGIYEQNYAAAQENRWDDIIATNWKYVANYEDANKAVIESTQSAYDRQKILWENLTELVKTKNGEIYQSQLESAENTLESLKKQLEGYGIYVAGVTELYDQIAGLGAPPLLSAPTMGGTFGAIQGFITNAINNALNGAKVEMDGEEMGKFVTTTVTRQVYSQNFAQ